MDQRDFERWAQRFAPVVGQADVDAAAREAGVETWETDAAPGESEGAASGRAGLVDPRSGQGVVTAAFPPAAAPPGDYAPGWPFLPFVQAWLTELRLGEAGSVWTLAWTEVLDPSAAAARVAAALEAGGWERLDRPDALAQLSELVEGSVLGVFRQPGYLRLLVQPPGDAEGTPDRSLLLMEFPR